MGNNSGNTFTFPQEFLSGYGFQEYLSEKKFDNTLTDEQLKYLTGTKYKELLDIIDLTIKEQYAGHKDITEHTYANLNKIFSFSHENPLHGFIDFLSLMLLNLKEKNKIIYDTIIACIKKSYINTNKYYTWTDGKNHFNYVTTIAGFLYVLYYALSEINVPIVFGVHTVPKRFTTPKDDMKVLFDNWLNYNCDNYYHNGGYDTIIIDDLNKFQKVAQEIKPPDVNASTTHTIGGCEKDNHAFIIVIIILLILYFVLEKPLILFGIAACAVLYWLHRNSRL